MTNYEKLVKTFPNIPDMSGFDIWGDFWDEEYCENKVTTSVKEMPDDAQMSDEDMAKYRTKLLNSIKIVKRTK